LIHAPRNPDCGIPFLPSFSSLSAMWGAANRCAVEMSGFDSTIVFFLSIASLLIDAETAHSPAPGGRGPCKACSSPAINAVIRRAPIPVHDCLAPFLGVGSKSLREIPTGSFPAISRTGPPHVDGVIEKSLAEIFPHLSWTLLRLRTFSRKALLRRFVGDESGEWPFFRTVVFPLPVPFSSLLKE